MIIRIKEVDIPVIRNILGGADIDRMNGIEVQAVKGRKEWNDGMGEFSSKGMKKGDKFYFVPFCNIYGAAEDVGYDIFEKLYGVSDLIRGIVVSFDAASIITEKGWRVFSYGDRKGDISLCGGGGYILKINQANFSALTFSDVQLKEAMQGLIVQAWGVEKGRLAHCFKKEEQGAKITLSSRITEYDEAFYVPIGNLLDALEEKAPDVIPMLKKTFGVVGGLNFALKDVSELYYAAS